MSARVRGLAPLAAAALLLLVPYREFFSDRVPVSRDLLFYFYPAKAALAEAARSGEMPWIDRSRWGGVPLLPAPGAAPFDPANLLFALLPLGTAAKAWILLRLLTGLAGFAAFARRLGLSPAEAAPAGLLYALSGPAASVAPFLSTSAAHSLLPWLAAFALDVRRRAEPRAAAGLALSAALILVSGSPEYVLYGALVVAALFVGVPAGEPPEPPAPWRRIAGALAVSGLLAALLAAPALLGGLATVAESSRTAEGGYRLSTAAVGALPPARLAEILSDGVLADWSREWFAPGFGSYYPFLPSVTPGRVALVLAAAGLALGGAGRLRALALAAVSVLLALGPATPAWEVAARVVPVVGIVRYPERHLLLAGFAFGWLGALGLRALERRLSPRAVPGAFAALAVLVLLDREGVVRRLVYTAPGSVLTAPPEALAEVPRPAPGETRPRLVHRDTLAPVPKYLGLDLLAANRTATEGLMPEYPALFGYASLFVSDYDLTLPVEAVEWTRLLTTALPGPGPMPARLLQNAGARAIVRSEPGPAGAWSVRVEPLPGSLSPWRFASRVVSDPDGRRLFQRFLEEGIDPASAYVDAEPAGERRPSTGRLVSVRDAADALTLVVEVDGPADAFLMLFRLRQACVEATLDDRPVPVAPMDFGFAGVNVPPGRHVVRLRPGTWWVKIGLVGTLTGCAVLLALALRGRRQAHAPAA